MTRIPVVTVVAQAIEHVHCVTRSAPAPLLDPGLPEPSSIIVVSEPDPFTGKLRSHHLESCTPGQDLANWYVLVRTGTYKYMMVHNSMRIPHLYKAVRTSTYLYIL